MSAVLVDARGNAIDGSRQKYVIGRDVTLDFSREISDTRIPSGERTSFADRRRLDRNGLALSVTVTVYHDHFYAGFFKSLLAAGGGAGAREIHEALEASRRSVFEIFARQIPLT